MFCFFVFRIFFFEHEQCSMHLMKVIFFRLPIQAPRTVFSVTWPWTAPSLSYIYILVLILESGKKRKEKKRELPYSIFSFIELCIWKCVHMRVVTCMIDMSMHTKANTETQNSPTCHYINTYVTISPHISSCLNPRLLSQPAIFSEATDGCHRKFPLPHFCFFFNTHKIVQSSPLLFS